ncbi:hypothetical protein ACTNBF_08525 [Bariatricus sp. HCP28S3_A4]
MVKSSETERNELFLCILGAIAQDESRAISDRIRRYCIKVIIFRMNMNPS